jgi:hypothetical protein
MHDNGGGKSRQGTGSPNVANARYEHQGQLIMPRGHLIFATYTTYLRMLAEAGRAWSESD